MASILAFDQGFRILREAIPHPGYNTLSEPLDLSKIAQIWTGGCIIRSSLLDDFVAAFETNIPPLQHSRFAELLSDNHSGLRYLVTTAASAGIPVPVLSSLLAYFDTLTSGRRIDTALIQLLRDRFGGHGIQLLNRPADDPVNIDWSIQ